MKTCPVCDSDFPDQHHTCPTDGAVLIVSHELAAGSLVRGKYRIQRKLGQGGMGVVYLAEHILLGGRVALKFLAGDLGKDPKFIKRFRQEARAAHHLRHPNIVEVTDLDQAEDGGLFIAMEYVEGQGLREALEEARGGFEILRALGIAQGIAYGLAAAHAHGTVHRDIKPENVLLARTSDGREQPKILDFGIAAIADSSTRISRTQGFLLTPDYAAPEQWLEMASGEMNGRTDLYALGCVIYEMLTGRTPFHAHNTAGWMKQHLDETPRPPSELRPEVGKWEGLDGLVMRLLAKNRDDRPEDAELLKLLDDLQDGSGTVRQQTVIEERSQRQATVIEESLRRQETVFAPALVKPSQPSPAAPILASRRFPGWALGVLVLLALAAGSAAVWLFVLQPRHQPDAQLQHQPDAQPVLSTGSSPVAQATPSSSAPVNTVTFKSVSSNSAPVVLPAAGGKTSQVPKPGESAAPAASQPAAQPAVQPTAPPVVQKPTAAEVEQQAVSLFKQSRLPEAAVLFDQACTMGTPVACDNLGVMYANGNGVAKDDGHAATLYSKACDAGDALGCSNLGNIYSSGRGVSKDSARAAALYLKACNLSNAIACSNLGNLYRFGNGVERDADKARQYLGLGCKMGNQWGCDRLKEVQ
ncbi:MAG: serine/threonine-protein kinase [Terracidiphilus sp.]|jgi:serine/threonine protein kinase